MKYKFFTIPLLSPGDAEAELNRFCSSHRIASVEKTFIPNGELSYWAFCLSYMEQTAPGKSDGKAKIDYREVLNEKDFALYAKLRALRKEQAEKESIPAYALFTNEQLAQMVLKGVQTIKALSEIQGIGKARIEKYGKIFLDLLGKELRETKGEEGGKEQK